MIIFQKVTENGERMGENRIRWLPLTRTTTSKTSYYIFVNYCWTLPLTVPNEELLWSFPPRPPPTPLLPSYSCSFPAIRATKRQLWESRILTVHTWGHGGKSRERGRPRSIWVKIEEKVCSLVTCHKIWPLIRKRIKLESWPNLWLVEAEESYAGKPISISFFQ